MPLSAGELTNKIRARHVFADWTRQKQAAQLNLQTPLRIEGASGGTNQISAHSIAVEGAIFTTAAEEQSYINEVNILLPPVIADIPVVTIDNPPIPSIPSGTALWATSCGGAYNDIGYSIVNDKDGNVYITGAFSGTMTIKQYSSAPSGGGAVVLSTYGTLQFTPNPFRPTDQNLYDIFIVKYNSTGQVLWATSCGGSNNDSGSSIATDNNGNVYVTGAFTIAMTIKQYASTPINGGPVGLSTFGTLSSSSNSNIFIIKYNSSGQVLWATNFMGLGGSSGNSIKVDNNYNVYVIGTFNETISINHYNSPPINGGAIGLSPYGTLTAPKDDFFFRNDLFIVKYNVSGQVLWATSCGSIKNDNVNSITIDTNNNIYITGEYRNIFTIKQYESAPINGGAIGLSTYGTLTTSENYSDIYIIKYNSSGQVLWATNCEGSLDDSGVSITSDTDNNIYLTGYHKSIFTIKQFTSNPIDGGTVNLSTYGTLTNARIGYNDIFLIKYTSDGQVLWATSCEGRGSNAGNSIAIDKDNNIYILGDFNDTITIKQYASSPVNGGTVGLSIYGTLTPINYFFNNILIIKYNSSGQALWATGYGCTSSCKGNSITTDKNNNIYIIGTFSGTMTIKQYDSPPIAAGAVGLSTYGTLTSAGGNDIFIIKYKA